MTTEPEQSELTNAAGNGESQGNQEWQLAKIVDAIAAEAGFTRPISGSL